MYLVWSDLAEGWLVASTAGAATTRRLDEATRFTAEEAADLVRRINSGAAGGGPVAYMVVPPAATDLWPPPGLEGLEDASYPGWTDLEVRLARQTWTSMWPTAPAARFDRREADGSVPVSTSATLWAARHAVAHAVAEVRRVYATPEWRAWLDQVGPPPAGAEEDHAER